MFSSDLLNIMVEILYLLLLEFFTFFVVFELCLLFSDSLNAVLEIFPLLPRSFFIFLEYLASFCHSQIFIARLYMFFLCDQVCFIFYNICPALALFRYCQYTYSSLFLIATKLFYNFCDIWLGFVPF